MTQSTLNKRNSQEKQHLGEKIRSIRLKALLLLSFGFLLILIILLGILSINSANSISRNTATLYERPHTNLVGMWKVKAEIAQTGNGIREWLYYGEPISDQLSANISNVITEMNAIEQNKVDKSAPVSENMQQIRKALSAWSEESNNLVNALQLGGAVTSDQLRQYSALEQDAINKIDSIIETATANAAKFYDTSVTGARQNAWTMLIIFIIAFLVALLLFQNLHLAIFIPMKDVLNTAEAIRAGNLDSLLKYHAKNEFGELADCFRQMQTYLKSVIQDLSQNLDKISTGDLRLQTTADYAGDFAPLKDSLQMTSIRLNDTIRRISESSENVGGGSNQVSSSAQALAQGATEQASSIEELAATISDISVQIQSSAQNAVTASGKAKAAGSDAAESNQRMQSLLNAMNEISQSSGEIGKIIKTIEDIAFQTNILALNAAVEAARAGTAGKGFAVVADEVRSLANKSAEASKSTANLIETSLRAVENGTNIAAETAQSLDGVIRGMKDTIAAIDEISLSAQSQADSISQVTIGVDQINAVVQTNSATAEESAAASEELFGQAQVLKDLVGQFRLDTGKPAPAL